MLLSCDWLKAKQLLCALMLSMVEVLTPSALYLPRNILTRSAVWFIKLEHVCNILLDCFIH